MSSRKRVRNDATTQEERKRLCQKESRTTKKTFISVDITARFAMSNFCDDFDGDEEYKFEESSRKQVRDQEERSNQEELCQEERSNQEELCQEERSNQEELCQPTQKDGTPQEEKKQVCQEDSCETKKMVVVEYDQEVLSSIWIGNDNGKTLSICENFEDAVIREGFSLKSLYYTFRAGRWFSSRKFTKSASIRYDRDKKWFIHRSVAGKKYPKRYEIIASDPTDIFAMSSSVIGYDDSDVLYPIF